MQTCRLVCDNSKQAGCYGFASHNLGVDLVGAYVLFSLLVGRERATLLVEIQHRLKCNPCYLFTVVWIEDFTSNHATMDLFHGVAFGCFEFRLYSSIISLYHQSIHYMFFVVSQFLWAHLDVKITKEFQRCNTSGLVPRGMYICIYVYMYLC